MSTWTTRALERPREYIILKHTLPGINYSINGVKFRNSYAVVEKDSKTYFTLKKIPMLKNAKELPLIELRKLSFITRTYDIFLVYGKDVYNEYLKVLEPVVQEEQRIEEIKQVEEHIANGGCNYILDNGKVCGHDSLELSPSSYCNTHILEDPKLEEYGFKRPRYMTKQERKDFREKALKTLEKNSKKILAAKEAINGNEVN